MFTDVWNWTAGMVWGEMKNQSLLMERPCAQTFFSRYICTNLTYSMEEDLLERLIFAQLVAKYPASYRTQTIVIVFTRVCYWP
jgi:hypothetical protein